MKTCPWCGRNNLDSDEYCFNCDRYLEGTPDLEETRELEREMRRTRVRKPPSILQLIIISIIIKAAFLLLALGIFSIFALVAIWVSYDNTSAALAAFGVLAVTVLCAFYYPDVTLSRRIGTKGALVSVLANIIILGLFLPSTLFFLSQRGYISGAWHFLSRTWWAIAGFLVLGVVIAWIAGRWAAVETPHP